MGAIIIRTEADIPRAPIRCACGESDTLKGLVEVDRRPPLTLYFAPMCEACWDAFGHTARLPYVEAARVFDVVGEETAFQAAEVVDEAFAEGDLADLVATGQARAVSLAEAARLALQAIRDSLRARPGLTGPEREILEDAARLLRRALIADHLADKGDRHE